MEPTFFPISAPIVCLIGPTAIGKTDLSIKLANTFDFEIISVDSMQVYKYMDIGTAKITKEEMQGIPHHLLDVVTPDKSFDAVSFEQHGLIAIKDILQREHGVLLTGGSGLYLKALLEGLSGELPHFPNIRKDLEDELEQIGHKELHKQLSLIDCISAKRIHHNDTQRLLRAIEIYRGTGTPWSTFLEKHTPSVQTRFPNVLIIGLTCERAALYNRIDYRSKWMLDNGLRQEVEWLLAQGYGEQHKSMRSIGYKHMTKYICGEWEKEKMMSLLSRDTRRYAKRQYTWFRKIQDIVWFQKEDHESIFTYIANHINM